MTDHVTEHLALAAAGALDSSESERSESERVAAHLLQCETCAARAEEWGRVAEALRRLPKPRPAPALVRRTREAVEARMVARAEQAFNRAVLAFLVGFAWTLTAVGWLVFELVAGALALRLAWPIGSAAAWYGAYVMAGWVAAAGAAVLLGRRVREEGRTV